MINKQELRIGNYLLNNGKYNPRRGNYVKVGSIGEEGVNLKAKPWGDEEADIDCEYDFEELEPIPLTPEILEKAGFRKDDSDDLARLGVQYILDLPIKGECKNEIFFFFSAPGLKDVSFGEYTVNSAHGSNNIYYLHQLQNLYFALTGQELEINL